MLTPATMETRQEDTGLRIRLLGGFEVTCQGTLVEVGSARAQALLAYLLLHRGAPPSRQQAAFALWPDTSEGQARANLRKVLLLLRQCWPDFGRYFTTEGQAMALRTDGPSRVWLDVAEFEHACSHNDASRAVALYAGLLLPDCTDEWLAPIREQLSQAHLHVLERLAQQRELDRNYPGAIEVISAWLRDDGLNERAHRALMRLRTLAGDPAGAELAYRDCATKLARELGVEPDLETRALRQQLRAATTIRVASQVPLIGRTREWQVLQGSWSDASARGPQCVVITGEAGIGKTRLADEMLAWANRLGLATAVAHCYAAEGALAYAPVREWLRSDVPASTARTLDDVWIAEVARLLPELHTARPGLQRAAPMIETWQRQRFFEGMARVVVARAPLILLLNDAQWCDPETLEWLHFLLRFNPRAPLLVIVTARSEEMDVNHPMRAFMTTAGSEGQLAEIALGPLDSADTSALAAQLARQPLSADHLAALYRDTEGHPLLVIETLRAGEDRVATGGLAGSMRGRMSAIIARRLLGLSPTARELAGLAAACGREFALDVLTMASPQNEEDVVRALDELVQRRFVRESVTADATTRPRGYDFTHAKLREAAYEEMSSARRRLAHRSLAEVLERLGARDYASYSGQIAAHFEGAHMPERAIPFYMQAATTARALHANSEAARHYQRALVLISGLPGAGTTRRAERSAIGEALGDVLALLGQFDSAREQFVQSLSWVANPMDEARMRAKAGNALRDLARYAEAMAAYRAAENTLGPADAGPHPPEWWEAWIQLQMDIEMVHYWLGDADKSADLLGDLGPLTEQHGTRSQRASLYQNICLRDLRRSRFRASDDMVAAMRMALDLVDRAGDNPRLPSTIFMLGFVLLWRGSLEESGQTITKALGMAEQSGDVSLAARCMTYLSIVLRRQGLVADTSAMAARSLHAAEVAHMPEYVALGHANLAWVAARARAHEDTRMHALEAERIWASLPAGHASALAQWTGLFPLLATVLSDGRGDLAVDYARRLLNPAQHRLPEEVTSLLDASIAAWDAGAQAAASSHLRQTVVVAAGLGYA